jgi:predicted nucleic-acid-binding protein
VVRQALKITADTNVLVRALICDDLKESRVARAEIAEAIRRLIDTDSVSVNRAQAEAGLAVMAAGGDFADGAVAYEGRWLGGGTFVSFDRKATRLLQAQGESVRLLV